MDPKPQFAYSNVPSYPDPILGGRLPEPPTPESIPKWTGKLYSDSGTGQKLVIPSSDEMSIIAKAPANSMICINSSFPYGEYAVDAFQGSRILELVSQEALELFCKKATAHCEPSMEHVGVI